MLVLFLIMQAVTYNEEGQALLTNIPEVEGESTLV
jgi:hypothetical protein